MEQREIDDLVALATSEDEAIADVSRAVRRLERAQDARARLHSVPADALRVALETRTRVLTGPRAAV